MQALNSRIARVKVPFPAVATDPSVFNPDQGVFMSDESYPDMCSTGPTERWLEHAAWLLSHDLSSDNKFCTGASGYVLRE